MKIHIPIILLLLFSVIGIKAQYIAEVHEYVPAPGQLINEEPWGTPNSANSIIGGINGSLSLGAFGGYVVFRFDEPIQNHPDHPFGIDFTIFGNPNPTWCEPGIVWVMQDENGNGEPDDTWFELAGSDYPFSTSIKNYEVTYSNPGGDEAMDVPWSDNQGNSGFVFVNTFHNQNYYPLSDSFPGVPATSYLLSGTLIRGGVDTTNPEFIKSYQRSFGYADNNPRGVAPYTFPDNPYTTDNENAGGDGFDLSWAVDESGNYVDLETAHFVKVQSAMMGHGGWVGEISTEITGACLVEPDPGITGENRMIIIRDLPAVIRQQTYQLEAFAFFSGLLQQEEPITWETNQPWVSVDENGVLTSTQNGNVAITAFLSNHPEISVSVAANIELSSSSGDVFSTYPTVKLSPNPTTGLFQISGLHNTNLSIFNHAGQMIKSVQRYSGESLDLNDQPAGIYLIRFNSDLRSGTTKLIMN